MKGPSIQLSDCRRKHIILILCIMIIFCGCQRESVDNVGVYYQAISVKEVGANYNPLALYAYNLLYIDKKMYTSTMHYQASSKEELFDGIALGDEIGKAYGNHHVFWSDDKEKLLENTCMGSIYQIKGYDEKFRIALYYETSSPMMETWYHLTVFEHLNDIWLKEGNDLYEECFHLSEAVEVRGYIEEKGVRHEVSVEKSAIQELLNALNEGEFLKLSKEEQKNLDYNHKYILSFLDSFGIATDITIYEEGFVSYEQICRDAIVLKIDENECRNFIEKCMARNS